MDHRPVNYYMSELQACCSQTLAIELPRSLYCMCIALVTMCVRVCVVYHETQVEKATLDINYIIPSDTSPDIRGHNFYACLYGWYSNHLRKVLKYSI